MQRQDRKNVQKNNWRIAQSEHGSLGSLGSKKCKHVLSSSRAYLGWTVCCNPDFCRMSDRDWHITSWHFLTYFAISCPIVLEGGVSSQNQPGPRNMLDLEEVIAVNGHVVTCYETVPDTTFVAIHWIDTNTNYRSMTCINSWGSLAVAFYTFCSFLCTMANTMNFKLHVLQYQRRLRMIRYLKNESKTKDVHHPRPNVTKPLSLCPRHRKTQKERILLLGHRPWKLSVWIEQARRSKAVLIKKEGFWKLIYTANRHVTNNTCLNAPTHERSNW